MKRFFCSIAVMFVCSSLYAAELLENREWKFTKTWNAAGTLKKLADGTYELENTGNAGSISMNCSEDEFAITPGKTYLVTVDLQHSSPEMKHSVFVALPGARYVRKPELRSPRESGNLAAMEFTARPDERRLAVYLTVSGTGKTIVKSVKIEEFTPVPDLIKRPGINWNFIAAPGAKGSMKRASDGTLHIEKTSGNAHVMAYLTLPLPIKAGKSYRVTMSGLPSDSVSRWGLMSHSGSHKSWPSKNCTGEKGALQTASLDVETAANDNGLRVYAVLHSTGSVDVKSIVVEELASKTELLPIKNWVANPSGSKGKAVKNADGSWRIEKLDDKGAMVFTFHGAYLKVIPKRHYLVEWQIQLAPGQKANSMTYLPVKPKSRTPWPGGKVVNADGKIQTAGQLITVQDNESTMRPHLVISGSAGNAIVKSCSITMLDDEELKQIDTTVYQK